MKGQYAEGTTVAPEKTRAEIETVLNRYGATGFAYASQQLGAGGRARIEFYANNRRVRFDMVLPRKDEPRFTENPRGYPYRPRSEGKALAAWEGEVRRLWRALLLAIKAKLEVVESGLAIFEEEFLANIVMPDDSTVGAHARPWIAQAYETGRVIGLLPAGPTTN
jgi:hypothetical protein